MFRRNPFTCLLSHFGGPGETAILYEIYKSQRCEFLLESPIKIPSPKFPIYFPFLPDNRRFLSRFRLSSQQPRASRKHLSHLPSLEGVEMPNFLFNLLCRYPLLHPTLHPQLLCIPMNIFVEFFLIYRWTWFSFTKYLLESRKRVASSIWDTLE